MCLALRQFLRIIAVRLIIFAQLASESPDVTIDRR